MMFLADNTEIIKILTSQIKIRDELSKSKDEIIKELNGTIKTLVEQSNKMNEYYLIREKEKSKKHTLITVGLFIAEVLLVAWLAGCYFLSDYTDHSVTTINGNSNSSTMVDGNSNKTNLKGAE